MNRLFVVFALILLISACRSGESGSIYVDSERGNDSNPGSSFKPIRTIEELNSRLRTNPSNIYFSGKQSFKGTIEIENIRGTADSPIIINSRGNSRAVIDGGNSAGINIKNCSNLIITDLRLKGSGRKTGNTTNGLSLVNSENVRISNIRSEGFRKSGVELFNCRNIELRSIKAYSNGFSGINVKGTSRDSSRNIVIKDCTAENNAGDPTMLDNHSGNGILVGVSDSVVIERCIATKNGWDMPRTGNGPVGIWAWESSNVRISYCVSYRNRTSKNAKDGGGFDLDGGVSNSMVSYCLSFGNEGAGFGLFQYNGASQWKDNIISNNISFNDATVTEGAGSIFIWNGSGDSSQLSGCTITRNLIVNFSAPIISFEPDSKHQNFEFTRNMFIGRDTVSGKNTGSIFKKNIWLRF